MPSAAASCINLLLATDADPASLSVFFFNDTATTEIYTLSLHDALPISVDLRYGVLVDIARKVHAGEPVSLAVPVFNVIWQRDANSYALRSLEYCQTPPRILNITGSETDRKSTRLNSSHT